MRERRPEILSLLKGTDQERIDFILSDRWFGYPVATQLLQKMTALLNQPDVTRPPNMLIVTHTNNGKTTLVKQFQKRFPNQDDPTTGGIQCPVVLLDVPPSADEDRLYNHILQTLGAVYKVRDPKDVKFFQICRLLRDMKMRVLVLDEINNALAGNSIQRQQMLNAIKELSNKLQRPIILTGTYDAHVVLKSDKQLQNRFPAHDLPEWKLDRDFLQLLVSFESILPLKKRTDLTNPQLAALLLVMCDGIIGELRTLLNLVSIKAIQTGTESITRKLLLSLDWVPPSQRNQQATAMELKEPFSVNYKQLLNELAAPSHADETELDLTDDDALDDE